MGSLEYIAARFEHFLCEHDIDPKRVKLVLRASDDNTRFRLEKAIADDLANLMILTPATLPMGLRKFELRGISISTATLDER